MRALLASDHAVVGVLTQPDRPAGRGRELRASAIKSLALEHGLPVAQPISLKSADSRAELVAWRPDLLVVVAYGLLLPPPVLALPGLGCVNIHASLLPRWRGAAPIQRALLAGDQATGVSIMQLDAGLDTGPVYAQRSCKIDAHVTAGDLHEQLAEIGAAALLETIAGIVDGTLLPRAQAADGVTYARKIEKAEAEIDWLASAVAIDRQIRAFNPQPIARTSLRGEPLRVHRAHVLTDAAIAELDRAAVPAPGQLLTLRHDALLVACGTGVLAIDSLQRAGKRKMAARDFVNAVPIDGQRLGQ